MAYQTSPYSDHAWLTAALMGEAGANDTPASMGALADVIMNRVNGTQAPSTAYGSSFTYSPKTVAGQISAYSGGSPQFSSYDRNQSLKEGNGSASANDMLMTALQKGGSAFSGAALAKYNQASAVAATFLDQSNPNYGRYSGSSGGSDFFVAKGFPTYLRNGGRYDVQTVGGSDFFKLKSNGGFTPWADVGDRGINSALPMPGSDGVGADFNTSGGVPNGSLGANGGAPPYLGPSLGYDSSGSSTGTIGRPNFGAGITPNASVPLPTNYGAIAAFYQHDLGRSAEANGLNYWGKELNSGRSLFDVEQAIRRSAEGQAYLSQNPRDQLVAALTPTLNNGTLTSPIGPGGAQYPISPGYLTSPLGPDAFAASPVGPPGISGTIGPGSTQYPVGPGSTTYPIGPNGEQISPVGPGASVGPVGPGQAQYPIGPDGFEVGAVPPGQAGGQVAPPPSQGALGPGAESQPVGPEGYGANPVGPPALTPTVPGPGLTPAVPAPNAVHAFDGGEYLAANPDVAASGMNAWDHYARFGYGEGRAIDAAGDRLPQGFSGNAYLAANQDVALSGMNPLEHFAKYGVAEGRAIAPYGFSGANVSGNVGPGTWNGTFDAASYLAANPDVAAAGAQALPHFLQFGLNEGRALDTAGHHLSQNFDGNAYLAQNQDVARAGMNPLEHYLEHGAAEGRAAPTGVTPWSFSGADVSQGLGPVGNGSFSGRFSAADYLAANRDVASSGMNAEDHYLRYGFGEGRALDTAGHRINQGFDPNAYLAQNQDVAAAKLDPLKHFLDFGAAEGRAAPTGGNPYQFSNFNVAQGAGPTGNGVFGISGITSSAPGGMGSALSQGGSNPLPAFGSNLNVSGGVGNGAFGLGGFAPADQSSSTASWESAAPNALPGSGGAGGSAFAYTDNRGQQQIATFDPQKSENAYLAGQVAQNQSQIEAGRASVANNPNLWNFGATNLLNSVAASNYQPAPIYSTATAATAALPPAMPAPFNSPLPVMQQGLQVNPAGGFGLISAF